MRAAPIISLVLSVGLGVGAIFLGRAWLSGGKQTADAATAAPSLSASASDASAAPVVRTMPLMVAARPLEPGMIITAADARRAPWPADDFPADAITSRKDMDLPEGSVWQVGFTVPEGQPLTESALTMTVPLSRLSTELAPGRRAVSITVTEETGVGGFVVVGDRVDVFIMLDNLILRSNRPVLAKDGDVTGVVLSNLLVEDAGVLAVDQSFDEAMEGAVKARTLTLDVSAADAQRLSFAGDSARLAVALRPRAKPGETLPEEPVPGYEVLSRIDLLDTKPAARKPPPRPASATRVSAPRAPAKPVRPKFTDIRIIEGERETKQTAPMAPEQAPLDLTPASVAAAPTAELTP